MEDSLSRQSTPRVLYEWESDFRLWCIDQKLETLKYQCHDTNTVYHYIFREKIDSDFVFIMVEVDKDIHVEFWINSTCKSKNYNNVEVIKHDIFIWNKYRANT